MPGSSSVVKTAEAAVIQNELKTVVDEFYVILVHWMRGLADRRTLATKWAHLIHPKSFSYTDASGTLRTKNWMTETVPFGVGASWMQLSLEVQHFRVLRQDGNLFLASFELEQLTKESASIEETTIRKVTAWLKRSSSDSSTSSRIVLLHLHETWVEGHGPKSNSTTSRQAPPRQRRSELSDQEQKQKEWKMAKQIPSRRRHVSDRLEEFQAKPLLSDDTLIGISIRGWDIATSQGPIGDEGWFNEATTIIEDLSQYQFKKSPRHRKVGLPEMVFPSAHVALTRSKGDLFLSWDAIDALKEWSEAHQAIPLEDSTISYRGVNVLKTSDAKLWKSKHESSSSAAAAALNTADAIFHFDWTYSTPFIGKLYGMAGYNGWTKLEASGMPMHLLTDQSVPILYFDEVILYEDDLHDNGEVQLSMKLRVMPTCAYILSKLFVRVDNVLLRLRESRLLVDFGNHTLYRDVTWRECQWDNLEQHMLPTNVRAWTPDNKELPAFMQLLNKIPLVNVPEDMLAYAEMKLEA